MRTVEGSRSGGLVPLVPQTTCDSFCSGKCCVAETTAGKSRPHYGGRCVFLCCRQQSSPYLSNCCWLITANLPPHRCLGAAESGHLILHLQVATHRRSAECTTVIYQVLTNVIAPLSKENSDIQILIFARQGGYYAVFAYVIRHFVPERAAVRP